MDEQQKYTEVRETNNQVGNTNVRRQSVSTGGTAPSAILLKRIVWFIAGVIIAFLALRFVLLLLGANQSSGFVDFVYSVGGFFAAPFYGIFNYQPSYGISTLEISTLVAIGIYALIAWGLGKLLTLNKTTA